MTEADAAENAAAETGARPSPWRVLRRRHYRNVWIGAMGSNIGNWMEMVAVQWLMAEATLADSWVQADRPGAPIMMGYLATAQLAPTLVLGLVGGVVADRMDRKKLLLTTQVGLMLIAAALAGAALANAISPVVLIVLGGLHGAVLAFNLPAWGVLTPRLVPREELSDAIALNGLQFNMARVIGPAIAGLLMGWLGPAVLLAVNAFSFLGVIIAVASTPPAPPPERDPRGAWTLIRESARFAFRTPGPLALMMAIFVFSMLASPLLRLLPIVIHEVYHKEAEAYGVLLSMLGGGAVVGVLTIKKIPSWYPRHHFIPLAVLLGGVSMGVLAAATTFEAALAPMFVCGVSWIWTFNSSFAALQHLVDDRMRGRVMAIANTLAFAAAPAGTLLAGVIGEVISGKKGDGMGTQLGLGALAVLLTGAGLVMVTWRTPEVDGLKPGDRGFSVD